MVKNIHMIVSILQAFHMDVSDDKTVRDAFHFIKSQLPEGKGKYIIENQIITEISYC